MSTADILNGAVAIAAAALLVWIGTRMLSWSIAVLPLGTRPRASANRWLPSMQLVLGVAIFTGVAVFTFGPAAAAVVAAGSAAIVLAASWFAVRDVVAGIVLRADHGFEEERIIRVDDVAGTILEVGARSLEIETVEGQRVRVPYSRLGRAAVTVGGAHEGTGALRFTITLPRDDSAHDDIAAIRSAALHAFFASASREPRVRLLGEGESERSYDVTVYADDPAYLPSIEEAVLARLNGRT
ncbi:MAG: mechanosensitive ion channel family protein [Gemmatimonadetes bacterium]|nr:mechanosensitive ion channel family protein [Gemmatimonadota bacterium]